MPEQRKLTEAQIIVLSLIKKALQPLGQLEVHSSVNWKEVIDIMVAHGVAGLCFEVVEQIQKEVQPKGEDLLTWYGHTSMMEATYGSHKAVIVQLADIFNKEGIKMNLMKGYGLSLNWPVPNHRPCADIDVFPRKADESAWEEVNNIAERKGEEIDSDNPHHSQFYFDGILIENHKTLLDVNKIASSQEYENLLESLIENHTLEVKIDNATFSVISGKLAMIHLLRHSAEDFGVSCLSLRQLVDWAMLVKAYHGETDWKWVYKIAENFNMHRFLSSLNGVCVRYLGMDKEMFPSKYSDILLEDRIIRDIMDPEFNIEMPPVSDKLRYAIVAIRRTFANRWKEKIIHREGLGKIICSRGWNRTKDLFLKKN